jgi:hypothetical protein
VYGGDLMDKNTYKVLKYIANHGEPRQYNEVVSKFKGQEFPAIDVSITRLSNGNMVSIEYSGEIDENNNPINPISITLAENGKNYLKEHSSQTFVDWYARILATTALVISIASLIVSMVKP